MRINVLGPVEVRPADAPVALAPKERALVATLALATGTVVSHERLSCALWDGRPPATVLAKLQTHVSTVRRALGQRSLAVGPLLTRGGGYQLKLERDELDLTEFDALLRHARKAAAESEPEVASEYFARALGVWRGPACATVTSATFRAAAEVLEQRRLMALEDKAEVDLTLGRNEVVVDELATQLAGNPLRERMRGLVMLALYRRGCRADAMAVFRSGRRLLAEEVGLEPGPELCRLHQAMLAGSPVLTQKRTAQFWRMESAS